MKKFVIQIRGTSGSGKTSAVRHVLKKFKAKPDIKNGRIIGYTSKAGVSIVGKYDNECGGCDSIKTGDELRERVENYAEISKVTLFEGLLASGLYARYAELTARLKKNNTIMVWAYLDTPIELCLERVQERRRQRGKTTPLDPTHTVDKHRAIMNNKAHALADGQYVVELDHKKAHIQLLNNVKYILKHGHLPNG